MADAKKAAEVLDLATAAKTGATQVPLNRFYLDEATFRLRTVAEFEKAALQALMNSLALEGQQIPVEAFIDSQKRYVPTKGYRRLTAMRILVSENHPRFKADMPVWTLIVKDATPQDLLLRAVLDNETRKSFTQMERLEVIRRLEDVHAPIQRAAAALGVSVKTYERDRLLVQYDWMFELIKDDCIVPSTAVLLLEVAKSENRVTELQEDLLAWVEHVEQKIEEKARLRKLRDGSDLRPAEQLVRKAMTKELVLQWIRQLKDHERFTKQVSWDFGAGIDADTNQLLIEAVKIDLAKDPLDRLAKVASKLSRIEAGVLEYLKRRHELEAERGPQDLVRQMAETPYNLDLLRQAGLSDLADSLAEEMLGDTAPPEAAPEAGG
jgi:hypothetical protein